MRCAPFAASWLIATLTAAAAAAQDPQPGQTFEFEGPGAPEPLPVFVPTDYDRDAPPPIFVFFPGTGGFPNTGPIPEATGGKGWVVVGAQYVDRGLLRPTADGVRAEWDNLQKLIAAIDERLPIDETRLYVGGFSKGGWTASLFVQHFPDAVAGAWIGGGGLAPGVDLPTPKVERPVYIGVGETDPNRIASLQAADYFEKKKAAVTYDEYPGLGHSYEQTDAGRAWFEVERLRAKGGVEARADEALAATVAQATSQGFDGYLDLERAQRGPWFAWASAEQRKALLDAAKSLRKDEELRDELAAQKAYERALDEEIKQRGKPIRARTVAAAREKQIAQKKKLLDKYVGVTTKHPDTHFGRKAVADAARIREHLALLEGEAGR